MSTPFFNMLTNFLERQPRTQLHQIKRHNNIMCNKQLYAYIILKKHENGHLFEITHSVLFISYYKMLLFKQNNRTS